MVRKGHIRDCRRFLKLDKIYTIKFQEYELTEIRHVYEVLI